MQRPHSSVSRTPPRSFICCVFCPRPRRGVRCDQLAEEQSKTLYSCRSTKRTSNTVHIHTVRSSVSHLTTTVLALIIPQGFIFDKGREAKKIKYIFFIKSRQQLPDYVIVKSVFTTLTYSCQDRNKMKNIFYISSAFTQHYLFWC